MTRQKSPATSRSKLTFPKTFEEVKEQIMMAKDTDKSSACSNSDKSESGNSSNRNNNSDNTGGGTGEKPPNTSIGDVIISPYVDGQGNIDYRQAVVKSSTGGDTAGTNILKKILADPVKPLPTFEIANIPLVSTWQLPRCNYFGKKVEAPCPCSSH